MKKVSYLLTCAGLVFALSGIMAVDAQDAVDPTSLDYVVKAYTNTLASTSLHLESQSQTDSTNPQGIPTSQKQSASFDVAKNQDAWDVMGSRTIGLNIQNSELDITLDSVVVGGEHYMQITGMPQLQGQGQGQDSPFNIPQGWFDATQMAASNQRVPGVGATDAKTFILTLLDALNLPVTGQSVTALNELPAQTVDNQPMRVFQLTLDPAVILQSDAATLLSGVGVGGFGGFGGFGGGRPGNGGQGGAPQARGTFTPPVEGTAFPTRQPPNPADYQITFAVYIGDQDQLIHRIYSVIAISPSAIDTNAGPQFARTITTQTDFTQFNVPVTITAPQVASS